MPPKTKIPKIEKSTPLEENSDSDTDQPPTAAIEKPKRQRSEAQIASFEKAKETKRLNALKRKGLADKAEEEIQNIIKKKQLKKEAKQQKLLKLQEIAEHVSSDEEEEEPVVIKKKVKKQTKPKIIYVDSDDEEVEKPADKNIIIINKMHPTLTAKKPKMMQPERQPLIFL